MACSNGHIFDFVGKMGAQGGSVLKLMTTAVMVPSYILDRLHFLEHLVSRLIVPRVEKLVVYLELLRVLNWKMR